LRREHDDDRALADRLVNYADAVVALSVVGVSGLGIAVADPDIRESLERVADWVAASNVVLGALSTSLIFLLRSWESDLRGGSLPSPKATRYSRYLHVARLVIIWVFVVQAVIFMLLIR
jgi:hypothetical protein